MHGDQEDDLLGREGCWGGGDWRFGGNERLICGVHAFGTGCFFDIVKIVEFEKSKMGSFYSGISWIWR